MNRTDKPVYEIGTILARVIFMIFLFGYNGFSHQIQVLLAGTTALFLVLV
jgi:hypothetical protein